MVSSARARLPFDNPAAEERHARESAVDRTCERCHGEWAYEFNQRLQWALRDGADPEEVGYRVMAAMADFNRELRASFADSLLAAEADSRP